MTIVIDATPLRSGHKTRGIGRYTQQLCLSLRRIKSPHQITVTSTTGSVDTPDLVHYPYFDLFQSHLPLFPQAPKEMVTIHDLIPLRFHKAFRPGIRSGINLWLQMQLVQRMSAIITDSSCSKNDITKFLRVDESKIFVIPLGVSEEFHPLSKELIGEARRQYQLPKDYLLYVGDVNTNKNIPSLIAALKGVPLPLVLVSSSILQTSLPEVREIEKAIKDNGVENRIIRLDRVPLDPNLDLVAIYNGATVYVQPSIYEGFGLPVLEAMACGTPVVSSNATSLPEVSGGAAFLVDPTVISMRDGIQEVLGNSNLRANLRKKGLQRAKMMTWIKTAEATHRLYESFMRK